MSIPKIIHYCWFGGNPKPKLAKKCFRSWKKNCPDYQIIEWNESNFDISTCPKYVQQAYDAKKWAFVTDYVRLKVVYENGGIYLDTDVELLKSLDSFLQYKAFFGIEDDDNFPFYIATGLGFGAEKGTPILKDLLNDYSDIVFKLSETEYDLTPCPMRNNSVFSAYGFNSENKNQILHENIAIFSSEYFCPICFLSGEIKKTENTFSIHHFSASWHTDKEKTEAQKYKEHKAELKKKEKQQNLHHFIKTIPNRIFIKLLGNKNYQKLKTKLKH